MAAAFTLLVRVSRKGLEKFVDPRLHIPELFSLGCIFSNLSEIFCHSFCHGTKEPLLQLISLNCYPCCVFATADNFRNVSVLIFVNESVTCLVASAALQVYSRTPLVLQPAYVASQSDSCGFRPCRLPFLCPHPLTVCVWERCGRSQCRRRALRRYRLYAPVTSAGVDGGGGGGCELASASLPLARPCSRHIGALQAELRLDREDSARQHGVRVCLGRGRQVDCPRLGVRRRIMPRVT